MNLPPMKTRLPLLLLAVCLLVSACGTGRKAAQGRTPSQRYEYRTGRPAVHPETQERRKAEKETLRKPEPVPRQKQQKKKEPETTSLKGRELIAYARRFLGTPYKYGANGPDRFDCSGFTTYVYKHFGIQLARSSRDQFSGGKPVRSIDRIQPGDLVFFARNGKIFHVGLAVESQGETFTFIHASNSGVIISRSDEPYWKPKYYGAKRMLD